MNMNFGEALEALKLGKYIRRGGWNGKGMFLFLQKGKIAVETVELSDKDLKETLADAAATVSHIGGVDASLFFPDEHIERNIMPYIVMYNAQGYHVPGWLASQTDMLAEDWEIAE